jgi:hypothetical protein
MRSSFLLARTLLVAGAWLSIRANAALAQALGAITGVITILGGALPSMPRASIDSTEYPADRRLNRHHRRASQLAMSAHMPATAKRRGI